MQILFLMNGFHDFDEWFSWFWWINNAITQKWMPWFRFQEHEILRHILTQTKAPIISTWGWTLVQDITRGFLKDRRDSWKFKEAVIYIEVSVDEAVKRIMADSSSVVNRVQFVPSSENVSEEHQRRAGLEKMQKERDVIYRQVSDIVVNGNQQAENVVKETLEKLRGFNI
jgi:shikimate kinase